uniref:Uncharacterized protein n=1 Tax=Rhizophora mucronata TaxID=61149 RepID=A0A2P2N7B1_RHIMU
MDQSVSVFVDCYICMPASIKESCFPFQFETNIILSS